ncbi:glutathione peroxidase 2-like [Carlito syrichta]|uniref:Glutathione peroxidase n=1 Tax=Carlito syrichta TaxID=1868482 RepID=A0A3Q0DZ66_CARSF|nr:glutathione peroxidase 2-like [Carlito syrichta]
MDQIIKRLRQLKRSNESCQSGRKAHDPCGAGPLQCGNKPHGCGNLLKKQKRRQSLSRAHSGGATAFIAKSFYDLSAIGLDGEKEDFNTFQGRAVPIENVASLGGTTTRDFTQLNELLCRFPGRLVVLGFPGNQFGHQENCQNEEILNSLKYARPGVRYQPIFTLLQKCDVKGQNKHPVFASLKDKLPYPQDDPQPLMTDPKFILWSPVHRSDVARNSRSSSSGGGGALPALEPHLPHHHLPACYQAPPQSCHTDQAALRPGLPCLVLSALRRAQRALRRHRGR